MTGLLRGGPIWTLLGGDLTIPRDDQGRQELSDINRAKKEDFLERVALDWYKEFEPAGAVSRWNVKDSENDERIIDEALSDCYDKLTEMMNY